MTDTWHLEDQRQFLERSLEDARREHEAGDLTDEDYDALRQRDEKLLAEVEASIAARVPADSDERPRADVVSERRGTDAPLARRLWGLRRKWWFVAAAIAMVLGGAFLLVQALTTPRLPGETATGTIDLNAAQKIERQLAQAKTLVRSGNVSQALEVYGTVLSEDPKQPVALAEWGWLDWEAASKLKEATEAAEGASALEEAVRLDRRLFAAEYYLGTVLVQEGAPKKAVPHFAQFLADEPTAAWRREAAPEIRTAYAAAKRPVPAGA
jgi:tetratricopeptide (TPR) repeat protein